MNAKRWLLLPFDGASSTGTATGNGEQDPDVQVSRKATAEDFSHKKEEDIVADYNAPIHMWVSYGCATHSSRIFLKLMVVVSGGCDALPAHSWHFWPDGINVQHLCHCNPLEDYCQS